MNIIGILIGVVVVALLWWALTTLLGAFAVPSQVQAVVTVIFVVLVVLWLLSLLGGINLNSIGNAHLGR